jgi:hypothetical protein
MGKFLSAAVTYLIGGCGKSDPEGRMPGDQRKIKEALVGLLGLHAHNSVERVLGVKSFALENKLEGRRKKGRGRWKKEGRRKQGRRRGKEEEGRRGGERKKEKGEGEADTHFYL